MKTRNQKRKPYPSDLSLNQFEKVASLLTVRPRSTGRPRTDLQEVVNGMLYVLSTGCRWEDLPHDFGVSYGTCYQYFAKWASQGKLKRVFEFLKQEANRRNYLHWRNAYLDASVVKSKKGVKNIQDFQANTSSMG